MQIILNENGLEVSLQSSLQSVLENSGHAAQKGIAVAVNNKVVPRAQWQSHILQDNDKVLVITATKGG